MKLPFTKMQGCGNDYIYVDCTKEQYEKKLDFAALSKEFSKRRFSIGADGIILICKSSVADAKMVIYNSDGSEGKMCGNGVRCVGKYLYEILKIKKKNLKIETKSGIKNIDIKCKSNNGNTNEEIVVNMGKACFVPERIPVLTEKICNHKNILHKEIIKKDVTIGKISYNINCVSMGNPHCVLILEDNIENVNLAEIAQNFEKSEIFPEGVNIEIVNIKNENTINIRVFERGSGETLACGTGACACFAVLVRRNLINKIAPLHINLKGGTLKVFKENESDNIFLSGPTKIVYEGLIEI